MDIAHPLAQLSSRMWSYCQNRLDEETNLTRNNVMDQNPVDVTTRSLKVATRVRIPLGLLRVSDETTPLRRQNHRRVTASVHEGCVTRLEVEPETRTQRLTEGRFDHGARGLRLGASWRDSDDDGWRRSVLADADAPTT